MSLPLLVGQRALAKQFGLKTNDLLLPPSILCPQASGSQARITSLELFLWKISSFDSRHELGLFTEVAGRAPPFLEI